MTSAFIAKLADDFEANGCDAIERCRNDDPAAYLRLVASLAPKNVAVDDGVSLLDFFAVIAAGDADRTDGDEEDKPEDVRH